jgi:hypothetical protein
MIIAVIVEDESDKVIVEPALRSVIRDLPFEVVSAGGRSSAISLARSYFTLQDSHVALLLDADTVNPRKVREQQYVLSDLLATVASTWAFEVVLAVPEIEVCLFEDPQVLAATFGNSLTSETLLEARFVPSVVLQRLIASAGWTDDYDLAVRRIVSGVTSPEMLAKSSPLQEVRRFIETAPNAERMAREFRSREPTASGGPGRDGAVHG